MQKLSTNFISNAFFLAEANGFGFVVHSHLNSALQLPQQCYEKGRIVLLS